MPAADGFTGTHNKFHDAAIQIRAFGVEKKDQASGSVNLSLRISLRFAIDPAGIKELISNVITSFFPLSFVYHSFVGY